MDDITKELVEINRILESTTLFDIIRKEVYDLLKNYNVIVIGGEYYGKPKYDVVIKHDGNNECNIKLTRRLRGLLKDNIEIKQIGNIVENILGIRFARRGRFNESNKT